MSDPQKAGGLRVCIPCSFNVLEYHPMTNHYHSFFHEQVVGKSIFGGQLTTMTSGYKSQSQLEYERERKRQENSVRPVPLEWKTEQLEKNLNANHDQYIKYLEQIRQQELQSKYVLMANKGHFNHLNMMLTSIIFQFSETKTSNKN